MNLKKAQKLFYLLLIPEFVLLVILSALHLLETWFVSFIFILMGYQVYIWIRYWKCPHCGAHLGRSDGPRCSFCGKKLFDK